MIQKPLVKNEPAKEKSNMNEKDTKVEALPNTTGPMVPVSEYNKALKEAVMEALKAAIPAAAIGINEANKLVQRQSQEAQVREIMRKTKRCAICGLVETACGGPWAKDEEGKDIVKLKSDGTYDYDYSLNHVKVYCGPQDPNLFKWFQGMRVNSIRFLPDYYGHAQWIPKKSDILTQVNAWENDQKDQMQRRTAEGMGAGAISSSGQTLHRGNPNAIGWR